MVEFSTSDKKRRIIVPKEQTNQLAELFGIYAGDGCLAVYSRESTKDYRLTFTSNVNEISYLQYVNSLVKNLFNLENEIKLRTYKENKWIELIYRSKAIVTYFSDNGFVPGKKKVLRIPDWVKNTPELASWFIRGLFDTDGHLAILEKGRFKSYPVISIQLKPREIVLDTFKLLTELGFKVNIYLDVERIDSRSGKVAVKNHLYLNGWENFQLWEKTIGSSNSKNLEKITTLKKAIQPIEAADL